MKSKIFQVKLVLDMLLICVLLFSPEVPQQVKAIIILLGFDYTYMCSERIDKLQQGEKK